MHRRPRHQWRHYWHYCQNDRLHHRHHSNRQCHHQYELQKFIRRSRGSHHRPCSKATDHRHSVLFYPIQSTWWRCRIIHGARRYGLSLRVFNSISHEWAQRMSEIKCWTWEDKFNISEATMCYFVYYMSTLLTRRSRLNSLFKERTRCHSFMALNRASDVQQLISWIFHVRWFGFSQWWNS